MKYFRWTQSEYLDKSKTVQNLYLEKINLADQDRWIINSSQKLESWNANPTAVFEGSFIHSDFPFTAYDIPVFSQKLKSLIEKIAPGSVQYLALDIFNESTKSHLSGYYIANYLHNIDCLDRSLSKYEVWTKDNLLFWEDRPQMLNTFRDIKKIVLNSKLIGESKLFRLWGWDVMVIANEDVKNSIELANITGCNFREIETV